MPLTETGSAQLVTALTSVRAQLPDVAPDVAPVVARARGLAPVATGRLARSIKPTATGGVASVGTPVRYGLPVHFGVPSRNQRPRPFLFQAVDAESKRVTDLYAADVQKLIEQKV